MLFAAYVHDILSHHTRAAGERLWQPQRQNANQNRQACSFRYATVQDIEEVKSRLDRQDNRFDRVDDRFDRVDDRFDRVDDRFDRVDEKFDRVDEKFDRQDERFDRQDAKMDEGFRQINARIDKLYYWIIGFGASIVVGMILIGVRIFIS